MSDSVEEHRDALPASETKEQRPSHTILDEKENKEYITGIKLFAVVGSLALCIFLLLLDLSILSTVGGKLQNCIFKTYDS